MKNLSQPALALVAIVVGAITLGVVFTATYYATSIPILRHIAGWTIVGAFGLLASLVVGLAVLNSLGLIEPPEKDRGSLR